MHEHSRQDGNNVVSGWLMNGDVGLHWREVGDQHSEPLIFLNSLGTDLRLWEGVLPHFCDHRCVRLDLRGHGLSDAPDGDYDLDTLTSDVVALIQHLELKTFSLVGVSLGGMIAQSLAVKMPKQVNHLVLSNTAMRMGDPKMWRQRMTSVREAGTIAAISDGVLARWFAEPFLRSDELGKWRNMLSRTPATGYVGCCAALSDADLTGLSSEITCPTLVIAGSGDSASPPEQVMMLSDAIPNAGFKEINGAGHLPMVETPLEFSNAVKDFLGATQ